MIKVIFSPDNTTKRFILSLFGKTTDGDGFVIEQESKEKVLDSEGQSITLSEFGGIKNGSEIYVRDNIVSLVRFYDHYLSGE